MDGGMGMPVNEYCKQIAVAIVDEMEAIDFYERMVDLVDADNERYIIENIITQETDHLKQLHSLLEGCQLIV